jgi:hypothetical protein
MRQLSLIPRKRGEGRLLSNLLTHVFPDRPGNLTKVSLLTTPLHSASSPTADIYNL